MCLAMNADRLEPGERCASTSNRNFEGRQGAGGRTHLVSPAMAAARRPMQRPLSSTSADIRLKAPSDSIMQKHFTVHKGLVAPMDRENVDTDAIIPKQFLKSITQHRLRPEPVRRVALPGPRASPARTRPRASPTRTSC